MKNFFKFISVLALVFAFIACGKKEEKTVENLPEQTEITEELNLNKEKEFFAQEVKFNSSGDLVVAFSKELAKNQNFEEIISLEPAVKNMKITSFFNKIIIKGDFEKKTAYNLEIREQTKDIDNNNLKSTVFFPDNYLRNKYPSFAFADAGNILPSINDKRINFSSVNVKKVMLKVVKVYNNNISEYLKKSSYSYVDEIAENELGDVIFTKEYNLDYKTDEKIQSSIDLSGVIGNNGVYSISLMALGEDSVDYDENVDGPFRTYMWDGNKRVIVKSNKQLILSDIGIIANSDNSKINIKTIDINNLNLLSHVKLEFINIKNQVIEKGYTDENGNYNSKVNIDDVFYVLATNNDDFNMLKLENSYIPFNDFAVGGDLNSSEIKTYIYTDKGFYRPGDEINVSLIARNNGKVLREDHPFTYTLYSANGSEKIKDELVNSSKNGFYTFKIKTDTNDETGAWTLITKFGASESSIPIYIEAKTTNKVTVDVDTSKIYSFNDMDEAGNLNLKFSSSYLTGIKNKNMPINYNITLSELEVNTEKYQNYSFRNSATQAYFNSLYNEAVLDENGENILKLHLPKNVKNKNLDIFISANVLDTNGRYSTEYKNLKMKNVNNHIGLKEASSVDKDGNVVINYIVLDEDKDSLVAGKKLKYSLYNLSTNWWYDSYYSDVKDIKSSLDTQFISSGEIITSDTPSVLNLSNVTEGLNYLEVEDLETGISSGIYIYNYFYDYYNDENAKKSIENLNISLDKEKYFVGDNAKLKFNSISGGKALITIEKDGKILKEYWRDLNAINTEETITVENSYFPNVYITVDVFQKYLTKENDRPIRLYGAVPLMVEDKSKIININLDTPETALPNSDLKIKISNKENKKMYYEVFLVDEGNVRLTNYQKPDPYNFFYQKQAKLVKNYDNFSNIIERYSDKVRNSLKTGGGDYEAETALMAAAKSVSSEDLKLNNIKRFNDITIFKGIFESDEQGNAEVDVKIPNYFGALRVYAVAVADDSFGSVEKKITVKAPVIIESSAPRVLKVGDKFSVPVSLFPIDKGIGTGEVIVSYEGKIFNQTVNLKDDTEEKIYFDLVAPEKTGTTKIEVEFKSEKYNFKDMINLAVDSSYPYQYTKNTVVIKPNEEFSFPVNEINNFIDGTSSVNLKLTTYNDINVDNIINSLLDYPYNCLEQITSKASAAMYASKFTTDEKKLNNYKNLINITIGNLYNNYQLENGAFLYWPNRVYYNNSIYSLYATDFIIEAKDKGYYVPEKMYELLLKYLNDTLKNSNITTKSKVNLLHVLAKVGNPNVSEMNIIFDNYYDNLPLVHKWKLLDSFNIIGEKDFAVNEAKKLSKSSDNKDYSTRIMENKEILKAYISINGVIPDEFKDIPDAYNSSDIWLSTDAQASLVEIASILVGKDSINTKPLNVEITINDVPLTYRFKESKYETSDLAFDNSVSKKEKVKSLKFKNISNENIYLNYSIKGKPVKFEEKDENKNLSISRKFITRDGKEININNLKVGDNFVIELQVKLENIPNVENISLVQILPSGFEIADDIREISSGFYNYDYLDVRDDRVAFFFNAYDNSDPVYNTFRIPVNVVSAGEFRFAGTKAEAMYNNNIRAYLKGFDVKISR